jgi:hypothetical protein
MEWYDYIKYIGTIVMCIPILFLFTYPVTFILYLAGMLVNIFVNYIVKRHEKQLPPLYEKRNFVKKVKEKYNFYEYDLYAYPSEKIQNIGYSIGFIGAYLAQNRKTMKNRDIYILSFMILLFYIAVIVAVSILYGAKRNSAPQMLAGKGIGLIIGILFFKLSEPMVTIKTI